MEIKVNGTEISLHGEQLRHRYLTWHEAINAEARGGIEELKNLEKFVDSIKSDSASSAASNVIAFCANATALVSAPIEPKRESTGDRHYTSFDINTKATYVGPDGKLCAKTVSRVLIGSNLGINNLLWGISSIRENLQKTNRADLLQNFPSIDNFLSAMEIEISFDKQREMAR